MRRGALSDYFDGVAVKTLKPTEVDPNVSNGHELQGVDEFRAFLGTPSERTRHEATYAWLSDDAEPVAVDLFATWYDSRRGQSHREPEYRLYYPAAVNDVVRRARPGDTLFLCKPKSGPLLALFCQHGSSIEQQLLWLFGLTLAFGPKLNQIDLRKNTGKSLDSSARLILDFINIEVAVTEEDYLQELLAKFGDGFPTTRIFSKFARSKAKEIDGLENPDGALVEWMDIEERLFLTLESHLVAERLEGGFLEAGKPNVQRFIDFSLSVHNRRKSRAGWALANHIEELLRLHGVRYKREATTEKRNGPDFLFPGEEQYADPVYPDAGLTMLAAKTTCKDRWRQVLREANRIEKKHLLTLEPGISESQTAEMGREKLQLVIPASLYDSYSQAQQSRLISVAEFIELVKDRQSSL